MSENLKHIAFVLDGNGRWAQKKGMPRTMGHKEGLTALKKTVKAVSNKGIPYITLYTFSTENWKRTEEEVGFLMGLIKKHLKAELDFYIENNLKVLHIGDITGLPKEIQEELVAVQNKTASFTGTTILLAINYGGRDEIIRAVKRLTAEELTSLDEKSFSSKLDTKETPPVDLLIRTGGEKRLSNFLLWQSAYAELYFSDILWPDWTVEDLDKAIEDYNGRERRFGKA